MLPARYEPRERRYGELKPSEIGEIGESGKAKALGICIVEPFTAVGSLAAA